jgi:hypothetical protein
MRSANDNLSSTPDSIALTKLEKHLNSKSCNRCFDLRPLAHAQVVSVREISAYAAYLSTLGERRWLSEDSSPFHGNEPLPNDPVRNIWKDYHFDRPTKTLLDIGASEHVVRDLQETQHQEQCSKCEATGKIQCVKCDGQGTKEKHDCWVCHAKKRVQCPTCLGCRFLVVWNRLHVKWYNHRSSITHILDANTILPTSNIVKASGKVICYEFDDVWSSSTQSIDNVLGNCVDLPHHFQIEISQQYQAKHYMRSDKILRLSCIIQRLHIKEIDYTLDATSGNTILIKILLHSLTHRLFKGKSSLSVFMVNMRQMFMTTSIHPNILVAHVDVRAL